MANIKSAKKRIAVNEKKRAANKSAKSEIATMTKKFNAAVEARDFKTAEALLREISGLLDSAAQDSVIHKNKASREKAKLAKKLHNAKGKK